MNWLGKHSIIVVDNSTTDQTIQITSKFPKITVIRNSRNLGFAQGNNIGASAAIKTGADLVMLLNNDTKVDPNLALELAKGLDQADITVPKIYFYPGQEFHHDRYKPSDQGKVIWYAGGHIDWDNIMGIHHGVDEVDQSQFNVSHEVEFATGCCMMIKRKVIDKIGLFDPRYYLYLEDADFSVRARRAGYRPSSS